MNCQKFESVVSELARGQMMAAEQRAEALSHSEVCEDCAARLSDERMLTLGLHSLAAEMESLEAPAALEANLLAAFRARPVAFEKSAPVRVNPRYWIAAIAATLLIAISLVVFSLSKRPAENSTVAGKQQEPQPQQVVQDIEKPAAPESPKPVKRKRIRPVRLPRPESASVANHVTKEIATDFIPLSYMSATTLQEGGQIIRVQLPRSALANFGLPVNMDRYNEKVKADVLYGVDGMARAIRFVQ